MFNSILAIENISMKKLILLAPVLLLAAISSCKKCYTCTNECVQCAITVNSNTFSHVLCKDSFATTADYNAAISADTGLGYICNSIAPTYTYDFCVNKPGEENYINYFNRGNRLTCTEK